RAGCHGHGGDIALPSIDLQINAIRDRPMRKHIELINARKSGGKAREKNIRLFVTDEYAEVVLNTVERFSRCPTRCGSPRGIRRPQSGGIENQGIGSDCRYRIEAG